MTARTQVMKKRNPLQNLDGSCWLSDDRIAARLSRRAGGIDQIDFHGRQPVSRNAVLLQAESGVLLPRLLIESAEGIAAIDLDWGDLIVTPATARTSVRCDGVRAEWTMALKRDTLCLACRTREAASPSRRRIGLQIHLNLCALTIQVHGQRIWHHECTDEEWRAVAQDRLVLRSWLRREGDYQGDFLIPESWRRLIFARRVKSGLGRMSDVWPEYRDSELAFAEAQIAIRAGGAGWRVERFDDSRIEFTVWEDPNSTRDWHAPEFYLQFSGDGNFTPLTTHPPGVFFHRQQKRYRQIEETSPKLCCPGQPAIERFFNRVPAICSASWVSDVGLFRACQGSYYWTWAWDNMVTGFALPRWGALEQMRKQIDFLRMHRDIDGSIPMRWTRQLDPMDAVGFGALDFLFSELVLRCATETADLAILRDNYPALVFAYRKLAERSRSDGLFPSLGFYPDLPAKLGRSERSLVTIDVGAWYGLCRNMAVIAEQLGDDALASEAAQRAQLVQVAGLHALWDREKGFFCDSIDSDSGRTVSCYGLYSLLVAESQRGIEWLSPVLTECAAFIEHHLLGPQGLGMTPMWDPHRRSEAALSSWYPHWDWIAVRLWLRTGRFTALRRWLELVESCLHSLDYCPEFAAIDEDSVPFSRHGAVWNLNCAAGWYLALIAALLGVEFQDDGVVIHDLDDMPETIIKDICFRGGSWTVHSRGTGPGIRSIIWNGRVWRRGKILPLETCTPGVHVLEIERE